METFRIELILLDEEGNKIQETVKNTCVKNHEKSLGQDMCLYISEFGVTNNDAKDTFVVKHPYKINFYRTTRVKKCDDFSGPVYGFNFKPFTDLLQERQDSTFAYGEINSKMSRCGELTLINWMNTWVTEVLWDMLLENLGGEASDHQIVPLVKYDKYDIRQDFLVKLQKVNLANIKDIAEIKSVVVVATIKVIERDNKWYYLACGSCNRIVDEKTIDKKDSDYGELKKQVCLFVQTKNVVNYKIQIRVLDKSGSVSLTLFVKVASKLLNHTAKELIREMRKNGDMDHFPEHFNILLGCTYAFKVNITKYCLDNHKFVYPVAMESTQESLSSFLSPPTMGKLKGALSGLEESSSFGYQESNDTPPLKRSVEFIHVEDISDLGRPPLNDISNDDQAMPKRRGRPPLNDMPNDVQVLSKRTATTSTNMPQSNASQEDEAYDLGDDNMFNGTSIEYLDHRDPTVTCGACGAVLWAAEARLKRSFRGTFCYSICCFYCKVVLPKRKDAPQALLNLYRNNDSRSKNFIKNVKTYNMMFSFTSMGGQVDHLVNKGNASYCFRIHGQNYHRHGSLLPDEGSKPKFAYLYIYDTENEVQNRICALRRQSDGREYNLTTASEVAALIVGDIAQSLDERDIVIETKSGDMQHINVLHPQQKVLQCESYQNLSNHIDNSVTDGSSTGRCIIVLSSSFTGAVYTIEFQKRGLPLSHICIFIHPDDKILNHERIDDFISAEIPDEEADPELYKLVSDHMMHGPCGPDNPSCPCTIKGNALKNSPKHIQNVPQLTLMDIWFIKDMMTDCRYLSACELCWRIRGNEIHYRFLAVERLPFHLPGQQQVVYEADDDISDAINKPSVASLKFLGWMECNKTNDLAKTLTYVEFPTKFIWKAEEKVWQERKRGYAVDDDREYIDAIEEENSWACGEYARKNLCLQSIDLIICTNRNSLDSFLGNHTNILMHGELCYNKDELVTEHETLFSNLTSEQKNVYTKVMTAVEKKVRGVFFLYGYGGTGKMYVWRTLSAALRSKGEIVLNVASSGIASLLLSGGHTAHSRFSIPINVNEETFCLIKPGSDLAALLEKTRKVIIFGGDFRQILQVIPRGTRPDVVHAILNSSYLWNDCEVLHLTVNMRLQEGARYSQDVNEIKEFADWILNIGDGKLGGPNDGEAVSDILDDLLIKDSHDPVGSLVQSVYHSFLDN
nr:uncharacterized protein [Tanacetum cinerariifolium]